MARISWNRLFEEAERARQSAYAPYSNFQVGAALWCDDGSITSGANVENASYGLTVCAERNAVGALVRAGRRIKAVAIMTDAERPTPPCGMCRQVLLEFAAPSTLVKARTVSGRLSCWTLDALLPHAFTRFSL